MNKDQEKIFITENYSKMTYKEMGIHLNRAQSYVYKLAKELSLIKKTEDLPNEIWLKHPDFPAYLFSNKGRIKGLSRQRVLKQRVHEGYFDCRLMNKDNEKKTPRTHRIVAELFVQNDNPTVNIQVNHIDGNKLNNKSSNLEWVTSLENQMHAINTGLKKQPNSGTILTEDEVHEICTLISKGFSYREIEKYNDKYKRSRVEGIRQRRRWVKISKNYTW